MISLVTLYVAIGVITVIVTVLAKLLGKKIPFLNKGKVLLYIFILTAAALYWWGIGSANKVYVIADKKTVKEFVLLKAATVALANGQSVTLQPSDAYKYKGRVVNNTPDTAFFDLVVYSKRGDVDAAYGHADILPYAVTTTHLAPEFLLREPSEKARSRRGEDVTKGWLHW